MGIKLQPQPSAKQVKRIVPGGHKGVTVPLKAFPQPTTQGKGLGNAKRPFPGFGT